MNRFFVFFIIAVALGCKDQGSPQSVSIVNNSSSKIMYLAVAPEVTNLIDISDSLNVSSLPNHLVAIGESREIEIIGYSPGKDIRVFIYRLATPDAVKAGYKSFMDVTDSQLRQNRYRVQVTD